MHPSSKSESMGRRWRFMLYKNKVKGIPLDHKCNQMNTKGMFASIFKFGNGFTLWFLVFNLHFMPWF
jgi:hypothetical protein